MGKTYTFSPLLFNTSSVDCAAGEEYAGGERRTAVAAYRNLVFKGGGVKGIAYLGALESAYSKGVMRTVERVAGTSAGAITATLTALFPEDFSAFRTAAETLEYSRVPAEAADSEDERPPGREGRLLRSIGAVKSSVQCTTRLVQERGWYSSSYFYSWIRKIIGRQFAVIKESYSFADFRNPAIHKDSRPFLDLYITGTDISNRMARIFSCETTPDMEVATAVRISMSIPLYFESREYLYPGTQAPQIYADGGILWNFPIDLFDDVKYSRRLKVRPAAGINEETLGFFLYSSPESTRYRELKGVVDYIGALFESLLLVQDQMILRDVRQAERTIFIDDRGVSPTQFDIQPGSPDYVKLVESGRSAAEEFFGRRFSLSLLLGRLQKRFGWKV
jgi:NTE family protein